MQLHIPVLLNETLTFAKQARPGIYLDATLGYAGHASAILRARSDFKLLGFDQDAFALEQSAQTLGAFKDRCELINCNFSQAFSELNKRQIHPSQLSFVLADIGVSSVQLDFAERGFSFESSKLDMRMNINNPLSAREVINDYPASKLTQIFCEFGELAPKLAADIAAKIISARPISSCEQLARIIGNAKLKGRSVALKTLIFQAVRIEVNAELDVLKQFLNDCRALRGCILAIISFHSLEDKIIKNAFKSFASECICSPQSPRCTCGKNHSLGQILSKKPIAPSSAECAANSRASCAKLRVFKFKDA